MALRYGLPHMGQTMTEMYPDRKLIRREREPERSYDLYDSSNTHRHFVEGSAGGAFGPAVSRLEFYRIADIHTSESGEQVEKRERTVVITMPTYQLVELLQTTLEQIKNNQGTILDYIHGQAKEMEFRINSMDVRHVDPNKQQR